MAPFGRRILEHWALDPEITYLNHGTVGHAGRGRLWARISARVYNEMADVERLATAVAARA